MSCSTAAAVGPDLVCCRTLEVDLKGFASPVTLHQVAGLRGPGGWQTKLPARVAKTT